MNRISLGCASLLVLGCALPGIRPVHAAAACASLAQELKLPHTTITLATEVPAGAFKLPTGAGAGGPGANFGALPAFCRVAGTARPTADSDIRFEVWMPLSGWNGKFVGGGNGVWAGSIAYGDMVTPLARGYATAASDVGHQGSPLDGTFLVGHPQKLIDFGHRAEHEMAVAAKATIKAFYGNGPSRSLYVSCSTGGRIGLMEAYRYPEDFDGISAMAPANPMVPLMVMSLWTGAATMKDPASGIPPPKFALVQKAALAACDANDGVKDGIITNPPACHFDPGVLQCKGDEAPDCLTAPQVTALRAIYEGPKNPRTGRQIYPGLSVGSEAQMPVLTLGKEPFPVATSFFRGPVFNDPNWDFRTFDYDHDVQRALAYGSDALDVPASGLKSFFAGNRKLLLSHGWSDGLIPSQSTVDFYQALVKDIGSHRAAEDVRLFMVPGMGHCGGGSGPSSVDVLAAIDQWVESGHAPERLIASNPPGRPSRTRPLCSYPKVATYAGHGDTDDEQNFRCETP
ncbi:MAG TPA: tannase/feruloyl esterase family alpha/beta hydrolase [Steroidobacteraceae bacterium]|nr:tannase/feruloyl esterase family alpha/beta hydrolase [Steroidobacteraceae bacterium]